MSKILDIIGEALRPCPFCHGEPIKFRGSIMGKVMVCVRCKDCGSMGPQFFEETKDNYKLAKTLWNERSHRHAHYDKGV